MGGGGRRGLKSGLKSKVCADGGLRPEILFAGFLGRRVAGKGELRGVCRMESSMRQ